MPGQSAATALEGILPRRCGICHLDKAPAAGAGLIAFKRPGSQAGAGDAGVCYSCHNGIVVDDRRTLWSGRHHPASGKVSCGSCHTPHVQAPNVGPFMRYPQGSYAFCTTCHPGRRAGDSGEHPAVAAEKGRAQDCGGCHMVHRAQGDGLIRAASAESLCGPCHGDNPSTRRAGPRHDNARLRQDRPALPRVPQCPPDGRREDAAGQSGPRRETVPPVPRAELLVRESRGQSPGRSRSGDLSLLPPDAQRREAGSAPRSARRCMDGVRTRSAAAAMPTWRARARARCGTIRST